MQDSEEVPSPDPCETASSPATNNFRSCLTRSALVWLGVAVSMGVLACLTGYWLRNRSLNQKWLLAHRYQNGEGVQKNLSKALELYQYGADRGHVPSQRELGLMYAWGLGPRKNSALGIRWLKIAAERGDVQAQRNLASFYLYDDGVQQNSAEGLKWYIRAANQGDLQAQEDLYRIYTHGDEIEQNTAEAAKWGRRAVSSLRQRAATNDVASLVELGLLFATGWIVDQDEQQANRWYGKAAEIRRARAEQGDVESQFQLGTMYLVGEGVPKDTDEAVRLFRRAGESGDSAIMYKVGEKFDRRDGIGNTAEAADWYRRAAERGNSDASFSLGDMYRDGRGVTRNDAEATLWLLRAAESGTPATQRVIAHRFSVFFTNRIQAGRWMQKAAEGGDVQAALELGEWYISGYNVPAVESEALRWLSQAVDGDELGSEDLVSVAEQFMDGQGVPKDEQKAKLLFTRGAEIIRKKAEKGNCQALIELGELYARGEGVSLSFAEAARCFDKALQIAMTKSADTNYFEERAFEERAIADRIAHLMALGTNAPEIHLIYFRIRQIAAQRGDPYDEWELGTIYEDGKIVSRDCSAARDQYLKAAEKGYADAQFSLGQLYEYGCGNLKPNYAESIRWYMKAANQNHKYAEIEIGRIYAAGLTIPDDYTNAIRFVEKAAENKDATAQSYLGWLYEVGIGVPTDTNKAYMWYSAAATLGEPQAEFWIGQSYHEGRYGVSRDPVKALFWYKRAAEHGHLTAAKLVQDAAANVGRLAKSSGNSAESSVSRASARPDGIEVIDFSAKATEGDNYYVRWAWKGTISNHTTNTKRVSARIQFLDKDGYELDWGFQSIVIQAGQTVSFTESTPVKAVVSARISKTKLVIEVHSE